MTGFQRVAGRARHQKKEGRNNADASVACPRALQRAGVLPTIAAFQRCHDQPMPRKSAPPNPASYADAVQQLEALVARLEAGQLPLEELLGEYQRGAALLAYCRDRLQAVQQQVQVLDEGATPQEQQP